MIFVETNRLVLRQWQTSDLSKFSEMCADDRVMKYFPKTLTAIESAECVDRFTQTITQLGFGFWAAEQKNDGKFIGFIGLNPLSDDHPKAPAVEIGWRLHADYWRLGLASEAASACLDYAFEELSLPEVISQTPAINHASIGVMRKIGMQDMQENFRHHLIPLEGNLSEHVLFRIRKPDQHTKEPCPR